MWPCKLPDEPPRLIAQFLEEIRAQLLAMSSAGKHSRSVPRGKVGSSDGNLNFPQFRDYPQRILKSRNFSTHCIGTSPATLPELGTAGC